jgi:hypothetical protein
VLSPGLAATYYDQVDLTGNTLTRVDPSIDFDWGPGSPDPALPTDDFSAVWTGELLAAASETYTIYATADDGVRVWLDENLLIDAWRDEGPTEYSAPITLVAGQLYSLRVEYYDSGGGAMVSLAWSSPSTAKQIIPPSQLFHSSTAAAVPGGDGLQATYYDTPNLTGNTVTRVDQAINFDWGAGSPDPRIPTDNFSARWTGKLLAPRTETFTIYATGDDGVRVYLGGIQIIDGWVDQGPTTYSANVSLVAGQYYDLSMEYYDSTGGATAVLSWSSPSMTQQVIPRPSLFTALP